MFSKTSSNTDGAGNKDKNYTAKDQITMIALGILLTAITAVVAYFAITKGLALRDVALTGSEQFYSGALLYIGASFGLGAALNLLITGARILYYDKVPPGYELGRCQVGLTIIAPVVVPVALCAIAACGIANRW